jgi:anti-sigma B factor antagonist
MDTESPVDFAVEAEHVGHAWVVAPSGELDLSNVDDVRAQIAARPPACEALVLDLGGLTFLDTTGMRLAVETLEQTRADGVRFALVRGGEDVQRLFVLAGLETRLPFFDDVRAAIDDR